MKKTLLTTLVLILTVTLGVQVANALGTLIPSGAPGDATQYTLNDIYTKLTTNTGTSTKSGLFGTPGSVAATFRTLTEIYTAIPNIDATKVATGTSYLGVAGTMQGLPAPLTWQTNPGLGLCWSNGQYETNNGCSIGNGWTAQGYGAVQYCANLVGEGSSDWRLPTISEYQTITDFTTFNNATQVPGFAQYFDYWSSTPSAVDPNYAWVWYTYYGNIYDGNRNNKSQVRCVR